MLGSNVPLTGGLTKIFQSGDEWQCDCIQVYLAPSRQWKVVKPDIAEIRNFKINWAKSNVKVVVGHVPFLVNLASASDRTRKHSIHRLTEELELASSLGVQYLVLHPGSYIRGSMGEGINRLITNLNEVLDQTREYSTEILLETMAGQGTTIGSTFEEIAYILDRASNCERLGVCLDTAHIFASGYDISSPGGYEYTFQLFDQTVGLDRIKVIHLNDSKTEVYSHKDRHTTIGLGEIGLWFFRNIIIDRTFSTIPKILEIPDRDVESKRSLQLLRALGSP